MKNTHTYKKKYDCTEKYKITYIHGQLSFPYSLVSEYNKILCQ